MGMEKVYINGQLCLAEQGSLVSRVLAQEDSLGISVGMPCGGQGRCGKCKVRATGSLSGPDAVEREKLTEEELAGGVRLACRVRILGECQILCETFGKHQVLVDGTEVRTKRLQRAPLFKALGAAVDLGTTTLAAQLYDRKGLVAQSGSANPQSRFGADVISRIQKSMEGESAALARTVRQGIAALLAELCESSGRRLEEIDTLIITGNTAMLYLLTGRNPERLSRAPFAADWLAGEWMDADMSGLVCKGARVWLPPCMSAFVGADTATALLFAQLCKGTGVRLLVDIGTNGEIALWKDGLLTVCSTAAGPAFEGAGLTMGMAGEAGAIAHVALSGEGLSVQVIGDASPTGICGSGVIDAIACLLACGELDETGYLEKEKVVIAGEVILTQKDIRMVQLAKSAILAGIRTLLSRAGITVEDLDELLVAGGFGSYLNLENAMRIGLLPKLDLSRIRVCGNAALAGAAKVLRNRNCMEELTEIVARAETLNLATDALFQEAYINGMFF